LKSIFERLDKSGIEWFLIGGFNHKVQGLNREANDLDIGIHYKDFEKTKDLFSDFDISKIATWKNKPKLPKKFFTTLVKDIMKKFDYK